jgi:predicted HAD superfamily Cof-like phosphohydrolase
MSSNFDKIKEFHRLFNLDNRESPYHECFDNEKLMKLRLALIDEEVQELHDSVNQRDFVETIDALTDIMYVTLGAFTSLGVDANEAFRLVHESNMTKLCNSEQEAKDTVEWYKERRPEFDATYELHENGKWRVFDKKSGKVLKNKYYKPVDLKEVCGLSL